MRTIILIVFLTSSISYHAVGQLKIGMYAGTQNSRYTTQPIDSTVMEPKFGLVIGIQSEIALRKDILLSFEPGYAVERSQFKVLVTPVSTSQNTATTSKKPVFVDSMLVQYNQFIMPLLVKVLSRNGQWHYLAGIGVNVPVNFLVKTEDEKQDIDVGFKPISIEGTMGIGYRLNIDQSSLSFGLRYNQSISRITDFNDELGFFSGLKSQSIRVVLSWRINLLNKDR